MFFYEYNNRGVVDIKSVYRGEKSFKCDMCKKKFSSKSGLVVHFKIHNEEKSFKCDVCSKKFRRKFELVSHGKLNLPKDQRNKFECDERDQTFTRKSNLRQHIKSVHQVFFCLNITHAKNTVNENLYFSLERKNNFFYLKKSKIFFETRKL